MIVHILPPATGFPAVSYNSDKVDRNKGELMAVSGFGMLRGFRQLRPEDYKHHLAMVSATNKQVKRPQFHAVISAEGKTSDKNVLTAIGEEWLSAMGYSNQPYLIIFHKDTANNHIHLVTSRVAANGKKISDSFEKIRAVSELNRILGVDAKRDAQSAITAALAFNFGTEAQFRLILESKGYILREKSGAYQIIRFGKLLGSIDRESVMMRSNQTLTDEKRRLQLKALFHKYAAVYATELKKGRKDYSSDFSLFLKNSFGVELSFHASGDKPPYGYTVVDHACNNVFKGSEIMPLKVLLGTFSPGLSLAHQGILSQEVNDQKSAYYAALLRAALHNYADLTQGLAHQGLVLYEDKGCIKLFDPSAGASMNTADLLVEEELRLLSDAFNDAQDKGIPLYHQQIQNPQISLSADIDDEAIHGRNRRRKKKARTNSR
jgi:hypothetical protein